MKLNTLKSDAVLLLVAVIWGLAFVAQRMGMAHIGPFTFNGIRFVLGCISLVPLLLLSKKSRNTKISKPLIKAGLISGFFLFSGISLQQVGLVYTTAGKAGFITGLYVIFVPFFNLFLRQSKTGTGVWIAAVFAVIGMYLLSVDKDLRISPGDFLIFLCAICFAFHLIVIARYSNRHDAVWLSFLQCAVVALLSIPTALLFEPIVVQNILHVSLPLLYGGVLSVGAAYSLQIYGQKYSPASHAAVILSMESVVAAIGGLLILNEVLSGRAITGCAFMLAGMLISQFSKTRH